MIVGRQQELSLVDGLVAAVPDGDAGLLLRGDPGIGKTALLDELVRRAAGHGIRVLRTSPSQAESRLALVGIGDLLSDAALPVLPDLPSPQRRALEAALLLSEPGGRPTEPRVLAVAVLETLRRLTEVGPVVLAIDDLQWLDAPSGEALDFALRRLHGRRIGIAATTRAGPGAPLPIDVSRATTGGLDQVTVGPLTVAALYRLLRDRLGLELTRPALVRVHDACGGNPLFALEIGRELREGRIRLHPGEPVPLPGSLLGIVERRTRRLPGTTRRTLAAAAALGRAERGVLEQAFGFEPVERSLGDAMRAGVVVADRDVVRFAHPLFASASYTAAPPHERRALHRRLAQVIDDPEERARHIALGSARRDAAAATALDRAAEHAAGRGAPAAAAELEELAIELTPLAASTDRVQRTLRAVELNATAGARARADALGSELLAELPPGSVRAEAALVLAATCDDDPARMAGLVEGALAEPGIDERLSARLHAQLADALFRQGYAREAIGPARAGLELARRAGDVSVLLGSIARLATTEFWAGAAGSDLVSPDTGMRLLEEGAALEETSGLHLPFAESPRAVLATRLVHLGAMDQARTLLTAVLTEAELGGDERSRVPALWHLAALEDYVGDWKASERRLREAVELEEQLDLDSGAVHFARAGHAATLGLVDEAVALALEGAERARESGDAPYELLNLGVIGFVRLSQGDATGAVAALLPVTERALELSEPRINRYWPDTIEALAAVGELDRAHQLLELYAAEAERLAVPRALARAAHCRGVLSTSRGDENGALQAFAEALAIHERCPNALEHARTLLALGIARRRFRHRASAREALEEARARFESLPAPLWAARAEAELARTGRRRREGEELTDTERQVAALAARGLTNREIGAQVFLTPKSVEDVLRRVYRALGVRNKAELAGLTRRAGEDGSPARG